MSRRWDPWTERPPAGGRSCCLSSRRCPQSFEAVEKQLFTRRSPSLRVGWRQGGRPTMMGQQSQKESLFYYFRLEDQIPETHLLRLIDRSVDFSFVRDRLTRFYSLTGRPSIDPE